MIAYIKDNSQNKCEKKNIHVDYGVVCNNSYFCKLYSHVKDLDIHVTIEDKEKWNNKADLSTFDDLNDSVSALKTKVDSIDLKTLNVNNYITASALNDYAKTSYVDQRVDYKVATSGFATTAYVKQYIDNAINLQDYYTRTQVDLKVSFLYKDYTVTGAVINDNLLIISLGTIGKSVKVDLPQSSAKISQEDFDEMLQNSTAIKTLTISKTKEYNPVKADVDISAEIASGGSSSGEAVYYKPYFYAGNVNKIEDNHLPINGQDPTSLGWTEQPTNGNYTWITFALITDEGFETFTTPTRITGRDGQTYYRSAALRWKKFVLGDKYRDGTVADDLGNYYLDIVTYNNVYYICVNTPSNGKWDSYPNESLCFEPISTTEEQFNNMLQNSAELIQSVSLNEVIAKDGNDIVAGVTSGKDSGDSAIADYDKGSVRIFAGLPQDNDLQKAPLTILNDGTLINKGTDSLIMIANGTIYFITSNSKYHLALSATGNGLTWTKDTFVNEEKVKLYKFDESSSPYVKPSQVTLYLNKDNNKYYLNNTSYDSALTGTYYELQDLSPLYAFAPDGFIMCGENDEENNTRVQIYRKITFKDGVRTNGKFVAIGRMIDGMYLDYVYNLDITDYAFEDTENYYCQYLTAQAVIGNTIKVNFLYKPYGTSNLSGMSLQLLDDSVYALEQNVSDSANPMISALLPNDDGDKEFSQICVCKKKDGENTYVITKVTAD